MNPKYQYFDGKKFTRDEKTGYYLCSTTNKNGIRQRMHVYVWEYNNGLVPEGYHVHHIDGDKANNDISNLELVLCANHMSLHKKEYANKNRDVVIKNLTENVAPKAKEWHRSEKGREWHKKHYAMTKDKLYATQKYICEYCAKEFESTQIKSRFCSNKCKSAFRRASGVDDIVKLCVNCGGEYIANKYQKTKYCPLCKNTKHSRDREC